MENCCLNCVNFTPKVWFEKAMDTGGISTGYCRPPWIEESTIIPLSGEGVCDEYIAKKEEE